MKKTLGIVAFVIWSVTIVSCSISDFVDIPDIDIGGCIKACNEVNNKCLEKTAELQCAEADNCFDDAQSCFDASTECSKNCNNCVPTAGSSCPYGEQSCIDGCADLSNSCFDMLDVCLDMKEGCMKEIVHAKEQCFDSFIGCTATCIDEGEEQLKSM